MLAGTRCLQKWVKHLLLSTGTKVCGRRVLVGGLLVMTLLMIVARQESEDQLQANTLVLQEGFPAWALVNSSSSSRSLQQNDDLRQHLSTASSAVAFPKLRLQSLEWQRQGRRPQQDQQPPILPPMEMAALVAAQRPKWIQHSHRFQPPLQASEARPSCRRLVLNNSGEQERAKVFMEDHQRVEKTSWDYVQETKNCSRFIAERGYVMASTVEEAEFPIAYSIMMYTGVEQAERLLRVLYRPHNYHCIHVDLKVPEELMQAMRGIAACLPNVFIASKLNKVYWSTWSSLEALIFCMEDLWQRSGSWKYYINLTGQEFPLKTNLQLVRILKALNGSNIVDASTDPSRMSRWYNNFSPPHNIVPYKGMVFMMACRDFVDYILHSPVARDFLQWVRYTDMPDETFFSSLNHNPHLRVPGSYRGPPDTNAVTKPYLARYVNWNTNWKDGDGRYNFRFPCYGMRVRTLCIFGVRDLPLLTNRKELFANKFYSTFEPLIFNCMEEWLVNMTIAEYAGNVVFNTSYYASLDIVRNKVV